MKGCARSCVLYLASYLAVVSAIVFTLHRQYSLSPDETGWVAAGAGFLLWVGFGWLFGIAQPIRERSSIRSDMSGTRPIDGKQTGIVGRIDAPGQRLKAPLSGTDCVAYKYEIYKMVRSGKNSVKSTFVDGIALIPSVITTQSGSYRLLSVPTLDFPEADLDHQTAVVNAEAHVRATVFEQKEGAWKRPKIEEQWTDDDGAYRRERKFTEDAIDIASCTLSEQHIKRGDAVYAFGLYSEQRGGLIPHPNWAKQTRIMKGEGEDVIRQLGKRITKYIFGGIFSLAAGAAVLFFFLRYFDLV